MDSPAVWPKATGKAVTDLLSEMAEDDRGRFSPSVYETGRLVSMAPSLSGHDRRVRYLLDEQRPDGSWGGPARYDIVPTLSATEALLTESRRPGCSPLVSPAAMRGIEALRHRLPRNDSLPDTVAIEIIVPGLVHDINVQLTERNASALPVPLGTSGDLLIALRAAVDAGTALPEKLWHSLETIGEPARQAGFVKPVGGSIVGCSPAATAVWLGDDVIAEEHHPSVGYLRDVQDPAVAAVPVAAPLALFERSWVLSTLADCGIEFSAPPKLVASLHEAFGPHGAAGGLGLPADADDTASALYALARLGSPRSPRPLWEYEAGDHFSTFPEERTPSTTTNAHVLQALGASVSADPREKAHCAAAAAKVTAWLVEQQQPDGTWSDKWHASPLYSIACCATALARYGGTNGRTAVAKAVDWLLKAQRADGSWGNWEGTAEETAFAVRTLLTTSANGEDEAVTVAAARGCAFLLANIENTRHPALWHDKDLYTPLRIIETEMLGALHLAKRNDKIVRRVAEQTTRIGAG
ncbi:prenyltransferase/squalene oxidase repeat-containing protein [Saccharomonospora sp. NPDC006951]